jgi:hypothetical protein
MFLVMPVLFPHGENGEAISLAARRTFYRPSRFGRGASRADGSIAVERKHAIFINLREFGRASH